MKNLGTVLRNHIDRNHLIKKEVAERAGITNNYLSTIFSRDDLSCSLWEKLCIASSLDPSVIFETGDAGHATYSDIKANTVVGHATVSIGSEQKALLDLLAEKERTIQALERTIQILMSGGAGSSGTPSGQKQGETQQTNQ